MAQLVNCVDVNLLTTKTTKFLHKVHKVVCELLKSNNKSKKILKICLCKWNNFPEQLSELSAFLVSLVVNLTTQFQTRARANALNFH